MIDREAFGCKFCADVGIKLPLEVDFRVYWAANIEKNGADHRPVILSAPFHDMRVLMSS